jgi:hypothetical protein
MIESKYAIFLFNSQKLTKNCFLILKSFVFISNIFLIITYK